MFYGFSKIGLALKLKEKSAERFKQKMGDFQTTYFGLSQETQDKIVRELTIDIVHSLKGQLGHNVGDRIRVGYAFGDLYRSIVANGYLKNVTKLRDTVSYLFEIDVEMYKYGFMLHTGIEEGHFPPPKRLAVWAEKKNLRSKWKDDTRKKPPTYKEIGFVLARHQFKKGKKPPLPGWFSIDENKDLEKLLAERFEYSKDRIYKYIVDDYKESFKKAGFKKIY